MSRYHHVFSRSIAGLALLTLSVQSFASSLFDSGGAHAPVADIQFDSSIPNNQYELMAQDLEEIQKFEFSNPDSKLLSVMGLRDSSPRSMLNWLKDRVHYIVGEKYNPRKKIRSVLENQTFPDSNESPASNDNGASLLGIDIGALFAPKTMIVMSNVGAEIYSISKKAKAICTFALPGLNDVTVTSPRTGIIQVGKGLFDKKIAGLGKEAPQSKVRFAFRMGTFFHEARHSDGHGKSLTFSHAICPAGHEYAGNAACDKNLNGAYTVGAHFFNSMARSCKECTSHDIDMIRMQALDSFSRILPVTVATGPSDPDGKAADRLRGLTRGVYFCQAFQDVNLSEPTLSKACSSLDPIKAEISKIKTEHSDFLIKNSTNWDPSPEEVRTQTFH